MKALYDRDFYRRRHQRTVHSARTILRLVSMTLPVIRSAADFGCGVGTWLSVLREEGVVDIQGFDGPWLDPKLLVIPHERYRPVDLDEKIELHRRYDLAISLEVAEHLQAEVAATFVSTLVNAADFVLFSAAIPEQGGNGHVNEQWPAYWAALFAQRGYVGVDCIRKQIWDAKDIPFWYRQNIVLYVKQERLKDLKRTFLADDRNCFPPAFIHPETYLQLHTLKGSFFLFKKAVARSVRRKCIQMISHIRDGVTRAEV